MLETRWWRRDGRNSTASERSRVRVKPANDGKELNSWAQRASVDLKWGGDLVQPGFDQ